LCYSLLIYQQPLIKDGKGIDIAAVDRIADGKSVTLTSGFTNSYYGLHYSYAKGITAVDASQADTESLNLTGSKSKVALKLKGADNANNSITGGKAGDTLTGGKGDDTLKGNGGADVFVQSGGNDVILDYTAKDKIQLLCKAKAETLGNDVKLTNEHGSILIKGGKGIELATVLGGNANLATTDDELWGNDGFKDTFLFDGGNDTIHNYEAQDEINLGGCSLSELINGAPFISRNSLVFAFDKNNSLTLTDALGTDISFADGSAYSRDGTLIKK